MSKGILYIMSTAVDGLIKIGKTTDFEKRMQLLESTGYHNVVGLKREFAIEVEDYDQKERILIDIFSSNQVGDSELFTIDLDRCKQLLLAFEGNPVFPKKDKEEMFIEATDAVEEKGLDHSRHHFKDTKFTSSLTGKKYRGTTSESGTLAIIDIDAGTEIPNKANPSKKAIISKALEDLGEKVSKTETLYQLYHRLEKIVPAESA